MTGEMILFGVVCGGLGFGLAVLLTLPALKKAAKEVDQLESELLVLQRMQAGVDYRLPRTVKAPRKGG